MIGLPGAPAPWHLMPGARDPGPKGFRDGTHRLTSPRETAMRVWALRRPLGITRVADITGLDRIGIPVTSVYRPNSRSLTVSQGKGLTLDAARASGLMEALESFHAERVMLPLKLASYREMLAGHEVVDPLQLPRSVWSTYHPHHPILWTQGWELLSQRRIWLPFESVHTNCTLPLPTGSGAFQLSSNGLASGNHLLEALSHGLCEVIERDASALWHCTPEGKRAPHRRLDLGRVRDPACREVLQRYAAAGVGIAAWDITTDVGVPVMACAIVDAESDPGRLLYATSGLGCHPSPDIALLRALTEAAQCRLTFISGARDDSDRHIYERARNAEVIEKARARVGTSPVAPVDHSALQDHAQDSFEADLRWLMERVAAVGVEQIIVCDLSQPAIGVPVVRVVVPGLEGIHDVPGYRPGLRAQAALAAQEVRP